MSKTRAFYHALLTATVLSVCACSSAVEWQDPESSVAAPSAPGTSAPPQVLQAYALEINPHQTEFTYTPIATNTDTTTGFLAAVLPFSNFTITNGNTSIYDLGANRLRLGTSGASNSGGLCLKNIGGKNYAGVVLHFDLFSTSGITVGDGGVSDGAGGFTVTYGVINAGDTICRPFSLNDPGGLTYYKMRLQIEGNIAVGSAKEYISEVNPVFWYAGQTVSIKGVGLNPKGGATACVTPTLDEKTFCEDGYLITAFAITADTDLSFSAPSDVGGTGGYVKVDNGNGVVVVGPHIAYTSLVSTNLRTTAVSGSKSVIYMTFPADQGLDANFCPPSTGIEDAEIVNGVAFDAVSTIPVEMDFLNSTGVNKNMAVVLDKNGDGRLSQNDYIQLVTHTNLASFGVTYPADAASIAVNRYHACGITSAGALYCWGRNQYGELGDGTFIQRLTPIAVPTMTSGVTAVTVGINHTCAIQNGALKCWGKNDLGQIGDGTSTLRSSPTAVSGLSTGVSSVTTGDNHTCAVHNGAAKCWGYGFLGQLGNGTTTNSNTAVSVTGLTSGVDLITAGSSFTCANVGGAVKCWGGNNYGQIGDGTTSNRGTPVDTTGLNSGVTLLSAGASNHICALHNGVTKCWGYNGNGQLGDSTTTNRTSAVAVTGLGSGVSLISAAGNHTCAILNQGALCWGLNSSGELGDGTTTNRSAPVAVLGYTTNARLIRAGASTTCAVDGPGGTLNCWGDTYEGVLGDGTALSHFAPAAVPAVTSGATKVSTSEYGSCVIQSNAAKCWGTSAVGSGTGTNATPTTVTGLTSGVTDISRSGQFACAVQSGAAKCWGDNLNGQLGNGTTTSSINPVNVTGMGLAVTSISTGGQHACAVQSGAAKCWGDNSNGQLGNSSTLSSTTPVTVTGLSSGVSRVFAGNYHSCAILSTGEMRCWGANATGQLGDNTSSTRTAPVQVTGLSSGVTLGSTATDHTCAVQSGQMKCWGSNTAGQIGDGTNSLRRTPTNVTGMSSNITAISAGGYSSCAVQNNTVKCWGSNANAQLGDGTLINSSTPVTTSLPNALSASIVATSAGILCTDQSGALYCSGWDVYGFNTGGTETPDYDVTPSPITGAYVFPSSRINFTQQIAADCN